MRAGRWVECRGASGVWAARHLRPGRSAACRRAGRVGRWARPGRARPGAAGGRGSAASAGPRAAGATRVGAAGAAGTGPRRGQRLGGRLVGGGGGRCRAGGAGAPAACRQPRRVRCLAGRAARCDRPGLAAADRRPRCRRRGTPWPSTGGARCGCARPEGLVRELWDAIADTLVRTPAAVHAERGARLCRGRAGRGGGACRLVGRDPPGAGRRGAGATPGRAADEGRGAVRRGGPGAQRGRPQPGGGRRRAVERPGGGAGAAGRARRDRSAAGPAARRPGMAAAGAAAALGGARPRSASTRSSWPSCWGPVPRRSAVPGSRCCGRPSCSAKGWTCGPPWRPRHRPARPAPRSGWRRCSTSTGRSTLGGEALTAEEVAALAEAKRPLVRLRGRWVRVDRELLERLRRRRGPRITAAEALAAALTGSLMVDGELVEFRRRRAPWPSSSTGWPARAEPPSRLPRACGPPCGPTSGEAWPGSRRCASSGSAAAWPTTWGWARRCR